MKLYKCTCIVCGETFHSEYSHDTVCEDCYGPTQQYNGPTGHGEDICYSDLIIINCNTSLFFLIF